MQDSKSAQQEQVNPKILNELEFQANKAYYDLLESLELGSSLAKQCEVYLSYHKLGEQLYQAVDEQTILRDWQHHSRETDARREPHFSQFDRYIIQWVIGNELSLSRVLKAENWAGSHYVELNNETDPCLMKLLKESDSGYTEMQFQSFQLAHNGKFVSLINALNYVREAYPLPR